MQTTAEDMQRQGGWSAERRGLDDGWGRPGKSSSLKQVIIVHRHGARFPTKPTGPENLSWPQRMQFWDTYKGHLTPVGTMQLHDIGQSLREVYVGNGRKGLFAGLERIDGTAAVCYTSNVQRTLQSAWSLLHGLLGKRVPVFFAFRSDRVVSDVVRKRIGVPIFIEDAPEAHDKLFGEWRLWDEYGVWRKQNERRSPFFQRCASDPRYHELANKLWKATGLHDLAPENDMVARLSAIKDVDTTIQINRVHALPLLPNLGDLELSSKEFEMIRGISREQKRCWFQDSAGGRTSHSCGKRAAGYLAHKIWRHLHERSCGSSSLRLVEFSCHDTTLAALANHLGVELPNIGFGAYFLLELHKSPRSRPPEAGEGPDAVHHVRVFYNPNPTGGVQPLALKPRVLPLGTERAQQWTSLPVGSVRVTDLEAHCKIPALEETFQALAGLMCKREQQPTRQELERLLNRSRKEWLSMAQWRERYLHSFQALDRNNSGGFGKSDVRAALSEWGINSDPGVIKMLWDLFDMDEDGEITQEELYLMIQTLIGVRGNISRMPCRDPNEAELARLPREEEQAC